MKIKPILLFLFVFAFHSVTSQITQTTLVFKDGRKVQGYGRLQGKKIKFVSKQQKKPVLYHLKELKEVQIKSYDTGEIETFEYVKIKKKRRPKVLCRIVTGRASLYYEVGTGSEGTGAGLEGIHAIRTYPINFYYMKLEGESELVYLGSDDVKLFGKKFAKRIREFFKDCPELVTKIDRGILRKDDVKKIVEFYNSSCK